jgi:iron(III) transport system permease protein
LDGDVQFDHGQALTNGRLLADLLVRVTALSSARLLYFCLGAVLIYLIVPPILILLQTSLTVTGGGADAYSTWNYRSVLVSSTLATLAWNSLKFAAGTSLLGIAFGSVLAFLVERTNTPLKTLAYLSAFITLCVPYVIWAIGWIFLLNIRNGVINVWLMTIFGLSSAPFDIFTMQGMILVDGVQAAAMAFMLVAVQLRSMDPGLEEAAAMSGARQWQILWRITMRLSSPALLAAFLVIFVRSIEAFETPALLGLPGGVHVLTTEIYQKIRIGAYPDYGLASAYGVIMILVASLGIYGYGRATQEAGRFAVVTGKGYKPRVLDLGGLRYITAGVVLVLPAIVTMPPAIIAWASFQRFYQLPSTAAMKTLTLANYVSVIDRHDVKVALTNSVMTAIAAATLAMLVTTVAAWLVVRTRLPGRSALDHLVSIPLALPGVVLGLAILKLYLVLPIPVYGTIWILMIAHVTRSLPFAMRYAHAGLTQIHKDLEESAQISGAPGLVIFRRILFPLLLPALFAGWVWVFLTTIRELPMTLMLVGPDSQMLASVIFDLWSGGQLLDMAAFSVMVTLCFVVLAFVLWRVSERWGIRF